MIDQLISELVAYGLENGLIDDADKVYVTNGLLELFQRQDYQEPEKLGKPRKLQLILDDLLEFALSQGILEDDTVTMRGLLDTKIMGILTHAPSVVRKIFEEKYQVSPKAATEFYYHFSQATNYIRTDRIIKDEKWETDTEFGKMDTQLLVKTRKRSKGYCKRWNCKKIWIPGVPALQGKRRVCRSPLTSSKTKPQDYTNYSVWRTVLFTVFTICIL